MSGITITWVPSTLWRIALRLASAYSCAVQRIALWKLIVYLWLFGNRVNLACFTESRSFAMVTLFPQKHSPTPGSIENFNALLKISSEMHWYLENGEIISQSMLCFFHIGSCIQCSVHAASVFVFSFMFALLYLHLHHKFCIVCSMVVHLAGVQQITAQCPLPQDGDHGTFSTHTEKRIAKVIPAHQHTVEKQI